MKAILAVEHGWQGMRELSLMLARSGFAVDVIIKGKVAPEVLAMVTCPSGMRVVSVSRTWFRWRLLAHGALATWSTRPVYVITHRRDEPSQERTHRWLERLRRLSPYTILLLEEGPHGTRLMNVEGRPIEVGQLEDTIRWFGSARDS
jgi:hypothetical protein